MDASGQNEVHCGEIPTLTQLIQILLSIQFTDKKATEKLINSLFENYTGGREDWGAYLTEGGNDYNRILIYEDIRFVLFLSVFPPRHGNRIHDHGDSNGLFKVLQGSLFERPFGKVNGSQRLQRRGDVQYATGDVNITPASALHCVRNLSHVETAVSLVLYFPLLSQCRWYRRTGESHPAHLLFGPDSGSIDDLHKIGGCNTDDEEENEA